MDYHKLLNDTVESAAQSWFKQASQTPSLELYLYASHALEGEPIGKVVIAPNRPDQSYFIVEAERIRPNMDIATARILINDRLRRAPILNPKM